MQSAYNKKHRIFLLDEIRGFSILCMVVYHGVYNLLTFFPISFPFFYSPLVIFLRDLFAGMFILISGVSCRFSRNNPKRGLLCLLFGMVMAAGSLLFVPELPIYFGILHFLGCAILLFALLQKALDHLPIAVMLPVLCVLFALSWNFPHRSLGFFSYPIIPLSESWYRSPYLFPIGLKNDFFYSADYFPIIPWIFLFLAGTYLGVPLKRGSFPVFFYQLHSRFLSFVGRHTLWIYLLHQPLLFGGMWLVDCIIANS